MGLNHSLADGAQLGIRKGRHLVRCGSNSLKGSAGKKAPAGLLISVFKGNVAYLMADNGEKFVVIHQVHDTGVNADGTIGARKGVYLTVAVYLVIA